MHSSIAEISTGDTEVISVTILSLHTLQDKSPQSRTLSLSLGSSLSTWMGKKKNSLQLDGWTHGRLSTSSVTELFYTTTAHVLCSRPTPRYLRLHLEVCLNQIWGASRDTLRAFLASCAPLTFLITLEIYMSRNALRPEPLHVINLVRLYGVSAAGSAAAPETIQTTGILHIRFIMTRIYAAII